MSMAMSPRRASSKTGSTRRNAVPGFYSKRRVRAGASEQKCSSILDTAGFRCASVECDLRVEHLRYWTGLFRVTREFLELCFVDIRHTRAQRQRGAADAKSLAFWFEADCRLSGQLSRRVAGSLQLKCERHGETSGMCGGN